MQRLLKWLRLDPADRRLLANAIRLMLAVRIGLRFFPLERVRRRVSRWAEPMSKVSPARTEDVERIRWAVGLASALVRGSTCLPQALTAYVLFRRAAVPASLRIGVARAEGGQLQAHAWVDLDGRTVVGNLKDLSRYTLLPPLFGEAADTRHHTAV